MQTFNAHAAVFSYPAVFSYLKCIDEKPTRCDIFFAKIGRILSWQQLHHPIDVTKANALLHAGQ